MRHDREGVGHKRGDDGVKHRRMYYIEQGDSRTHLLCTRVRTGKGSGT